MNFGSEEYHGAGRWTIQAVDDHERTHLIEVVGQGRKYLLSGQRAVWLSYVVEVDGIKDIPQGRLWRTKADAFDAGVRYLKSQRAQERAG
jgi:hypothetical protein